MDQLDGAGCAQGSSHVAAHRLGRTCYGCELEPKYADVVLRRSEAEGLTVEKVGG